MPNRKPAELRILDGGAGNRAAKQPEKVGEKSAKQKLARAPKILDKSGKKYWREIVPQIAELGILHTVDRAALIMLCEAYSDMEKARVAIDGDYMVSTREGATVKRNPACVALDLAANRFRLLAADFGLTPKARLALGVLTPAADEDDEFERLTG